MPEALIPSKKPLQKVPEALIPSKKPLQKVPEALPQVENRSKRFLMRLTLIRIPKKAFLSNQ